jgi:transcriptional regulator with XRE-family HTH domain
MNAARILRYARRRAGLTQRQLAEKSGIPQPTVTRVERGQTIPRVDTFDRLLRACDIVLEPWPHIGAGEDRTLFTLDLSPSERLHHGASAAENTARLVRSVRK